MLFFVEFVTVFEMPDCRVFLPAWGGARAMGGEERRKNKRERQPTQAKLIIPSFK
jgi:hypothetical protein